MLKNKFYLKANKYLAIFFMLLIVSSCSSLSSLKFWGGDEIDPDKPVLLVIPSKISAERCAQKHDPFPDTPERRMLRYDLYTKASQLRYWKVIDAVRPIKSVFSDIINDDLSPAVPNRY